MPCTSAIKKAPGYVELQHGILTRGEQGSWTVRIIGDRGSGILSSISQANCFIVMSSAQGDIEPGDLVDVQLLEGLI